MALKGTRKPQKAATSNKKMVFKNLHVHTMLVSSACLILLLCIHSASSFAIKHTSKAPVMLAPESSRLSLPLANIRKGLHRTSFASLRVHVPVPLKAVNIKDEEITITASTCSNSNGTDMMDTDDSNTATNNNNHTSDNDPNQNQNQLLQSIPSWLQNYPRDSGVLRDIVDTLTRTLLAPAFYYENPHCFPEFIRISEYPHWLAVATSRAMFTLFNVTDPNTSMGANAKTDKDIDDGGKNRKGEHHHHGLSLHASSRISFQKESYGTHPRQTGDVMIKEKLLQTSHSGSENDDNIPLFLFLHGGAWGSGFPTMYRLISSPFLERNYRAVVLGYRTYPDGGMEDQVQDLVDAVEYFTEKYASRSFGSSSSSSSSKVVLMGHSSGAHIAMLAALRGRLAGCDALIGMSGVYDLEVARTREIQQGLTELSPMGPACGDINMLREHSPTWLVDTHTHGYSKDMGSSFLNLPPILLVHGEDDPVAPPSYSKMFHNVMKEDERQVLKRGATCHLEILKGLQHQDTVLETCLGHGKTQSLILQWLDDNLKKDDL